MAEERALRLEAELRIRDAQIEEFNRRASGAPPANGQQQPVASPQAPRTPTAEELNAEVDRRAAAQARVAAAETAFAMKCNDFFEKSRTAFPDFEAKLQNFQKMGGLPPQFVDLVIDTGNGAAILRELGGNLDEAARITSLSPLKAAVELDRMARRLERGPALSAAPRPPTPVGNGRATTQKPLDQTDMEDFIKRRETEIAKRGAA